MTEHEDEYIYGRNTVLAYLEGPGNESNVTEKSCQIDKIFLAEGLHRPDKRIEKIKELARQQTVLVHVSNKQQLERLVGSEARHQGIVARLSQTKNLSLDDFLQSLKIDDNPNYLIAVADSIQDPHNLGAIIRVAHAVGAKGLITTTRRTAGTTGAVAKASAGAIVHLPIVRVNNLVSALEKLKTHGFWIAGLDAEAQNNFYNQDLRIPLAVVIGSESKGLGRLVGKHCDFLLKIPMSAKSESLNAAVAAGIVFYEHFRQNCVKKNN